MAVAKENHGTSRSRPSERAPKARALVLLICAAGLVLTAAPEVQARRKSRKSGAESLQPSVEETVSGRVVKVSDGDTITVLAPGNRQVKVRLFGIDAPEKSQPFGNACRELLASRVAGREVKVDVRANDRYGRTVGVVKLPGATGEADTSLGVNVLQVKDGCAWHYRQFTRKEATAGERERLDGAEADARGKKLRLWSGGGGGPQAPWEYRREEKKLRSSRRGSRGR